MRVLKSGEQLECRLRNWKVGKTPNKGSIYVRLSFDNFITKTLWFSPKSEERSYGVLKTLGYKFSDLTGLADPNALDRENFYLVTVDKVTNKDGKYYYEASWVNKDVFSQAPEIDSDIMDDLKDMDTRAYIDGTVDSGLNNNHMSNNSASTSTNFATDDIPF